MLIAPWRLFVAPRMSAKRNRIVKILINGAGIAGLSLAHCLQNDGHDVVILEKADGPRSEGYMMDFFGVGFDVAEKLGMLDELEAIHYPIPRLAFIDDRGREQVSIDYFKIRKLLDDRHFNFMRGDLERILYAKVKDRVEIRFATTVDSLEQHDRGVSVTLSNGTAETVDLLVGADGVHSRVRSLVFGKEDQYLKFLGYYVAAFIIDDPPAGFEGTDAFSTMNVPGRQVAIYPIRENRLATYLTYKSNRNADELSGETARGKLREIYKDLDWIVPDLLAKCPAANLYFDSVSQIEMPAWRQDRVVLVGDACQCVSLLAGQGASMAMAGAYVLAEELNQCRDDIAAALGRYQARVKPDIQTKQAAARRFAKWFVPESRFRIMARNIIIRAAELPFVTSRMKRLFGAESSLDL